MMKVPFLDLWRMHEPIANELRDEFARLLENNAFTGGDGVANFERSFASWTGHDHCVGVGSGHDALIFGLRSIGVEEGVKVIAPAMTFISTVTSIIQAGGTPVLVDVDNEGLIDLNQVEDKIKEGVKYVLPVHLYGQMVDPKVFKLSSKNMI